MFELPVPFLKVYDWPEQAEQTISLPEAKDRFGQLRLHLEMDKAWQEKLNTVTDLLVIPVDEGYSPTPKILPGCSL